MDAEYTCVKCWTMYDEQEQADSCCACEECAEKDKRISELEAEIKDHAKWAERMMKDTSSEPYRNLQAKLEAQLAESDRALDCMTLAAGELQDVCNGLEAQLDAYPCYMTWMGCTDNEGEPENCAMQGIEDWDYCPVCKAAIGEGS